MTTWHLNITFTTTPDDRLPDLLGRLHDTELDDLDLSVFARPAEGFVQVTFLAEANDGISAFTDGVAVFRSAWRSATSAAGWSPAPLLAVAGNADALDVTQPAD